MAAPRVLDDESRGHRLAGTDAGTRGAGGHRQPAAHHVRVVDAAPEMAAVRHVTILALHALAREATGLPLRVRVLEQLAVERESIARELMTAATERGRQERRRAR